MVDLDGLEPSTSRLSGVRSNHLSYRSINKIIGRGRRTRTLGIWFWRPTFYQLNYTPKAIKLVKLVPGAGIEPATHGASIRCSTYWAIQANSLTKYRSAYGGERGIWTLASRKGPTPLAGEPLQPLEYFSKVGGGGGIRTHACFHTNGFQDRPVMATSVPLRTLRT